MSVVVASVLAERAGWGHMAGWGWGWMVLIWLLVASVIGLVVWAASRSSGRPPRAPTPEEVLEERFARGELTPEEFEERRKLLRG